MTAITPSARQRNVASPPDIALAEAVGRRPRHVIAQPLAAICAVQAAISLSLVWSNAAFWDEGEYLWLGRLVIAHWLHGTDWPPYENQVSGSPMVYPPLGAIVDSAGGLAAARVLSLAFMLGATVLLYLTASRLIGRTGALFASALWATSEPVIRLAFATFDPLSVLLTAAAGWLAVQAGFRRRPLFFVAGSAVALALANVTAYSGIVIDPVVIAFAFLTWLPRLRGWGALRWSAWLAGGLAVAFVVLMTVSQSWAGMATIIHRAFPDYQSIGLLLGDIWKFSGLVMTLAVIGACAAAMAKGTPRAGLLILLGCAAFVVPAAQLRFHTAWSLDKHLAYGIWFAAIAAGYGCSTLLNWLPGGGRRLAALCGVLAFVYPSVNSWESAWAVYHEWPNVSSFISSLRPVVANSRGLIDASRQVHLAEYYTVQGLDWRRWTASGLPFDPVGVPQSAWKAYYAARLRGGNYGVIALFYATASPTPHLSGNSLSSSQLGQIYRTLIGSAAIDPGEPGVSALTMALEADRGYRLIAVGPYSSASQQGAYAIWQQVPK